MHECLLPTEGSRRVNFDESIRNVCYRIENKRNHNLHYKLNVSIHNASDVTNPKIVDIVSVVGVAKGTLYYHFSSKEEIFNFLVDEGIKLLKNSIEIKTRYARSTK